MQIRRLAASDDRKAFASGDADLDRFFQQYAGQNQFRHHLGTTYVAVDEARIVGFATVTPGEIEVDRVPASWIRMVRSYALPILRLARLAVHREDQGRGIGNQLLRFVLELAIKMAIDFGCIGVVVDAKEEAIRFYERLGFVSMELEEGDSRMRPALTSMFLSLRKIKEASGK